MKTKKSCTEATLKEMSLLLKLDSTLIQAEDKVDKLFKLAKINPQSKRAAEKIDKSKYKNQICLAVADLTIAQAKYDAYNNILNKKYIWQNSHVISY